MSTKLSGITQNLNNMKSFKVASDLKVFENFPRDFPQSKFGHKKFPPFNFVHIHKKQKTHKSWLDMINPFECESDYEDDDDDDYGD